ncbi:MAG TPA: hypothetical protein VF691_03370 [Cytophagaceae bacterium]
MTKILLIICSLIITLAASAQISLAPVGTEYNYVTTDWMGLPFSFTSLITEKDTIVDGLTHRKLLKIEKEKNSEERYHTSILVRQSNDSVYIDNSFMYYLGGKKAIPLLLIGITTSF